MDDHPAASRPVVQRAWDAAVRVFHWSLVACFVAAWLTRHSRWLDLHAAFGYATTALIVFRVVWGFVGSGPARFTSFVASPSAAWRYLRSAAAGSAPAHWSHNPAGGWSVLGLLTLGAAIALSGLALLSAQFGYGPLGDTVGALRALWLRPLHEALAWTMLGLVAIHLLGVAVGVRQHGRDLATAMVTGHKAAPPGAVAAPRHARTAGALFSVVLACVAMGFAAAGDGPATDAQAAPQKPSMKSVALAPWPDECGSCHLAYPPELLPLRSWQRMLEEQDRHFGEDLGLSDDKARALLSAARAARADGPWAGVALRAALRSDERPLRISETSFWRERHEAVDAATFKTPPAAGPHDCEACHRDAPVAVFSPRSLRLPK